MSKKEITMQQWMDEFEAQPKEIQFMRLSIAYQKAGYFAPIGSTFYNETKEKYPQYFDKNGNLKP